MNYYLKKNTIRHAKARHLYAMEAVSANKLELQSSISQLITEYENYPQTVLYIEELNEKFTSLQLQLYVLAGI